MRVRNVMYLLLSMAMLALTACGGGGGSSVTPNVTGTASKGLIKNGHIQAFQILSSANPAKARLGAAPIATTVTDDKGHYALALPTGMKDSVLIKVVDGTYIDEATQVEKHIEVEFPNDGMRAAFGNISGAIRRGDNLSVSPFTEMAVRRAGTALDDNSVDAANKEIEHAFGLDNNGIDIRHSKPLDPSVAPGATAKAEDKAYTHALAVLSEYEKDNDPSGSKKLTGLSDDLVAEIHGNGGALLAGTLAKISAADDTIKASGNDQSVPVAPPTIVVTAPGSGLTGSATGAAITATATTAAGAPIANLEIKFTVKAGTALLSQKSVLTDANGVATVNLTSAADSTGNIVTASVGSVSKDSAEIIFITQPTKAILKLSSTGVGTSLVGGMNLTVTLPAGVTAAKNADGSTASTTLVGSGAGSSALLTGNAGTAGQVTIGLISANGIAGGEFATLSLDIAPGTFPKNTDFAVTVNQIIDASSVAIAGGGVSFTLTNQ